MSAPPKIPANRIVVIMPNWLGDAVQATPFLRALRALYPNAHIAALARPIAAPVLSGLPCTNDLHILDRHNSRQTIQWLRSQNFDLGILLPNSFRSAWLLFRAGIKRRMGYARDWRTPLLTDRLSPMRRTPQQKQLDLAKSRAIQKISTDIRSRQNISVGSPYQPVPTIDYYLKLAEYLGAPSAAAKTMQLAVTPEEKSEADQVLASLGITTEQIENQKSKIENIVVIVPGANFGSSKCWLPERFAQVADRIMDRPERGGNFGAHVLLASSPAELPIVDAILAKSLLCPNGGGIGRLHALAKMNAGKGLSLGALKEIVRRSKLMLCNDTGPRHFAAALQIPTLTLFGPTDPTWAETYSSNEKILRLTPPCSPCQLKQCPIDHRCMKDITTEMVYNALKQMLHQPQPETPEPDIDPRTHNLTI
jgi:heptosyltransferase II